MIVFAPSRLHLLRNPGAAPISTRSPNGETFDMDLNLAAFTPKVLPREILSNVTLRFTFRPVMVHA